MGIHKTTCNLHSMGIIVRAVISKSRVPELLRTQASQKQTFAAVTALVAASCIASLITSDRASADKLRTPDATAQMEPRFQAAAVASASSVPEDMNLTRGPRQQSMCDQC